METIFPIYNDSEIMAATPAGVLPPVPAEVDLLVIDNGESTNNSYESSANNSFQAGPTPKKETTKAQENGQDMKAIVSALESSMSM